MLLAAEGRPYIAPPQAPPVPRKGQENTDTPVQPGDECALLPLLGLHRHHDRILGIHLIGQLADACRARNGAVDGVQGNTRPGLGTRGETRSPY